MRVTRVLAIVAFWIAGTAAQAQSTAVAPSYAIMPLIGDKITVVVHQISTGSHWDKNIQHILPMPDDSLDGTAAFASDDAVKRVQRGALTMLYTTRDAKLFALQDKLIDSPDAVADLAQSMKAFLSASKASHLILITKYRTDTRVRMSDGYIGSGQLSGIGFYVDPNLMIKEETGEVTQGYFTPYAYFKLSLLDAATLQVLRQATATTTQVHTAAKSQKAKVAWEALTPAEKVDALNQVIRGAIDEAMPKLLGDK